MSFEKIQYNITLIHGLLKKNREDIMLKIDSRIADRRTIGILVGPLQQDQTVKQ